MGDRPGMKLVQLVQWALWDTVTLFWAPLTCEVFGPAEQQVLKDGTVKRRTLILLNGIYCCLLRHVTAYTKADSSQCSDFAMRWTGCSSTLRAVETFAHPNVLTASRLYSDSCLIDNAVFFRSG
jgi:hypothetical protein